MSRRSVRTSASGGAASSTARRPVSTRWYSAAAAASWPRSRSTLASMLAQSSVSTCDGPSPGAASRPASASRQRASASSKRPWSRSSPASFSAAAHLSPCSPPPASHSSRALCARQSRSRSRMRAFTASKPPRVSRTAAAIVSMSLLLYASAFSMLILLKLSLIVSNSYSCVAHSRLQRQAEQYCACVRPDAPKRGGTPRAPAAPAQCPAARRSQWCC